MAPSDRSIGDVLVDRGVITAAQLEWAAAQGASNAATALLEARIVTEAQVIAAAADHLGVPFADLAAQPPDPSLAARLNEEVARRARAVPISGDATSLTVAVADPTDADLMTWLARQAGTAVRAAIAVPSAITEALDALYPRRTTSSLDALLGQVVAKGASDLHLSVGRPPGVRIDGRIWPLEGEPPLTAERARELVDGALSETQRAHFAD